MLPVSTREIDVRTGMLSAPVRIFASLTHYLGDADKVLTASVKWRCTHSATCYAGG